MTRPLTIPENQMRAIIRAARKEGARLEVKMGNAVVAVFPDDTSDGAIDKSSGMRGNSLRAWRERHAGKARGST